MNLPKWDGETVFILGGGESLKDFNPACLEGHRVIGVNESGLSLYPDSDILFWADRRWVEWNFGRLDLHTGPHRVTTNAAFIDSIPRVTLLKWNYLDRRGEPVGFTTTAGEIAGFDAGGRCINLAWHCGARRVVLLGFDCRDYPDKQWRRGNWHTAHKLPPLPNQRTNKFIPGHEAMAKKIRDLELDFTVLNATPGSALTCWPTVNLEDVLCPTHIPDSPSEKPRSTP